MNAHKNPFAGKLNNAKKYVASKTLTKLDWSNSELIDGDVTKGKNRIKEQDGPEIQVHGSGNLIQTLLKHGLGLELYQDYFDAVALFISKLFTTGFSLCSRFFNTVLSLSSRFFTANPLVSSEGSNFAQTKYIKCPFSWVQGPVTMESIIFATDEIPNA